MKTILVQLESGPAAGARMQCALDLARAENAHLTCLAVTPLNSYVTADPFGGIYAMPTVLAAINEVEEGLRVELESRLAGQDISWEYVHVNGYPPAAIAAHARLADLVVLGKPEVGHAGRDAMALLGEVVLNVSAPVLAVPANAPGFNVSTSAAIGWNGSFEAANAVRAALPLLRRATSITVIAVTEERTHDLPDVDVRDYLERHGLTASIETIEEGELGIAGGLVRKIGEIGAGYLVMGAYGHSRVREYVFGGVTRWMLRELPVPLLLAH